jgi:hypothetical protein
VTSGEVLFAVLDRAGAYLFDHQDLRSQEEVDLVGDFLQEARDCGDISGDLEPSERVRTAFAFTKTLEALELAGFWVFGATEDRRLEGGIGPPTTFTVAILYIARADNPLIVNLDANAAPTEQKADDAAKPPNV